MAKCPSLSSTRVMPGDGRYERLEAKNIRPAIASARNALLNVPPPAAVEKTARTGAGSGCRRNSVIQLRVNDPVARPKTENCSLTRDEPEPGLHRLPCRPACPATPRWRIVSLGNRLLRARTASSCYRAAPAPTEKAARASAREAGHRYPLPSVGDAPSALHACLPA